MHHQGNVVLLQTAAADVGCRIQLQLELFKAPNACQLSARLWRCLPSPHRKPLPVTGLDSGCTLIQCCTCFFA